MKLSKKCRIRVHKFYRISFVFKKTYEYPILEQINGNDGKRHYICPITGAYLPSVTTILDETADKVFLKKWIERVGESKAEQIRNEAAGLGTLLHEHMECYIQDIPRPKGTNLVRKMAENMADTIINKGLPDLNEIWGIESRLYFPGLYAGTTDLVGIYGGKEAIMDYKNTKKMKSRSMLDNYFDQTVAYALAHNELFDTNIRKGVIFMVARDLQYETFILEGAEFDKHEVLFLKRLEKYMEKNSL